MFSFKSKYKTIRHFLLAASLATMMPLTYAAEVIVDCNNDDLHQKIADAASGDVLLIKGTCSINGQFFLINKPLTLKNNDQNFTTPAILDGQNDPNGFPVVIIQANNVSLIGLTIKNGSNGHGIRVFGALNASIKNSKIQNNGIGVYVFPLSQVTIEESLISDNTQGLDNSGNLTIKKSTIANNISWGLYLSDLSRASIDQSTFSGNKTSAGGSAINHVNGDLRISQSTFANNTGGSAAIFFTSSPPFGISIENSIIANNTPQDLAGLTPPPNNKYTADNINLGSLDEYGGPTTTLKLLNPENAKMNCNVDVKTDQRGAPRPGVLGTGLKPITDCNMGAYEAGDALLVATPNTVDYGSIAVGSVSAAAPLVIANHGNDTATGLSATVTGPFAITMPLSVTTLKIMNSAGVNATFNPTAAGAANGNLNISYNNVGASPLAVPLTGTGTSVVIPPTAQIQYILDTFHQGIKNNTIYGVGKNKVLAKLRLIAFDALLQLSDVAIKKNKYLIACGLLQTAAKRSDGQNLPPDLITGSGVADVNQLIVDLRTSLNCGPLQVEKSDTDKDNDAGNVKDH